MNELTLVNVSLFCNIPYCCLIVGFGIEQFFLAVFLLVHILTVTLDFEGTCARYLNFYERIKNSFFAFEFHENAIEFLMHYKVSYNDLLFSLFL